MSSSHLLISVFVFAILRVTSSEKCLKFDGDFSEGSIVLNTSVICSCYKPEPGGPEEPAAAAEKTCNVPLSKKVDGIITITLEDLCGKCKSAPIVADVPPEGPAAPLVASSSVKPLENVTVTSLVATDNVTESASITPEGSAASAVVSSSVKPLDNTTVASSVATVNTTESASIIPEVASPAATDNTTESASITPEDHSDDPPLGGGGSAPNATEDGLASRFLIPSDTNSTSTPITKSTVKPLESASPVSPATDKSVNSTTVTEDPSDELPLEISSSVATKIDPTSSTSDGGAKSEHLNRGDSGSGFSGGSVFLFFLCGAIVGVFLVLAVKYVRNQYKSRSYVTNDAPQP